MRSYGVVAVFVFATTAFAAPPERHDTVLLLGAKAGAQTVAVRGNGSVRVAYAYKDRDHGDDIVATWTLDAAGIPIAYRATGNDYMNAAIDERYAVERGKARWSTRQESGEQAIDAAAFYLPVAGPPEILGVLARALLKAPGHRLPLLPNGEARLERVGTLVDGAGAKKVELTHYRISGLGFSPAPVWLDADGTTWLASSWFSTVPQGREGAVPRMLDAQNADERAWHAALATKLARKPHGDLVFRNARVFDPRDLSTTPGTSVLVRGERVIRVAPDAQVAAPDAETIDAQGRFLMPGLWDNHQHFGGVDGLLDIAAGVTSARDLANDNDEFLQRVERFDAGTEVGPRVLKAGMIDGNGPFAGPTKMRVDDVQSALRAVDWYADHGYVQIKTYMSIKPEFIAPMADRAHARGLRFSGHVPAFMSAQQFVNAGADEIQHFNYVVLDLLYPEVQETNRRSERFGKVAEHARDFMPDHPRVRALIDFFKRHRTVLDPTLGLFEMRLTGDPRQPIPGLEEVAPRLPPQVRRATRSAAYEVPKGQEAAYRAAMPAMYALLKALHDAGVVIVPGTDALPGWLLHHELELYARAGIAPAEVLRMATLTSAQVMGVDRDRGVIAPGKLADLVLIDGDPTTTIADVRRVRLVVKGGTLYDPAAIERELGLSPRE